jgi:biotin-dependent carboxylase-like uncharacterized protein
MNAIRIVEPGFQTTVQDLGRFGYAHLGVSASGAADALALRAANLLVGNAENTPGLEMALTGAVLEFTASAVIALAGSDFRSGLVHCIEPEQVGLPLWAAVELGAGTVVSLGPTRSGARCYLAVRGGIGVPKVLGSASTHLVTGLGGRALSKGDILPIGGEAVRRARARAATPPVGEGPLRVTAGPQAAWFREDLYGPAYRVTIKLTPISSPAFLHMEARPLKGLYAFLPPAGTKALK